MIQTIGLLLGLTACKTTTPEATPELAEPTATATKSAAPSLTDDVAALVIRRIKPGVSIEDFEAARDAYVAVLTEQDGIGTDREFEPFLDFLTYGAPDPKVFIGFTQGDSLPEFGQAADIAGATPESAAFFATFDLVKFGLLTPLEQGTPVDIAPIAPLGPQVLEVAVRDLSRYDDFDAEAYAVSRDRFIGALAKQPGVLAEHQWISPADPNLAVGMTVYESKDAFMAVAGNQELTTSPAYADFVNTYPLMAGYAATVVK